MSVPIEDFWIAAKINGREQKEKEIRQTMNKIYIVDFYSCDGESWSEVACPTIELAKKEAKRKIETIFHGKEKIVCKHPYATHTYYKGNLLKAIDAYEGRKYEDEPYMHYSYTTGTVLRIGEFPLVFNID